MNLLITCSLNALWLNLFVSLVAFVVGATCRPGSFDQFWVWADRSMPGGNRFHMVGLAGICWAIWRSRNSVCFEKKLVRSPIEIICLASSFIFFWAELQQEGDREALEAGAEALKSVALSFHPQEAPTADTGVVLLQ